jgi:hypothetical protein
MKCFDGCLKKAAFGKLRSPAHSPTRPKPNPMPVCVTLVESSQPLISNSRLITKSHGSRSVSLLVDQWAGGVSSCPFSPAQKFGSRAYKPEGRQPVRLADGCCWFVVREKYCWLVAVGWFVLREKYRWPVADKPNEQAAKPSPRSRHFPSPRSGLDG